MCALVLMLEFVWVYAIQFFCNFLIIWRLWRILKCFSCSNACSSFCCMLGATRETLIAERIRLLELKCHLGKQLDAVIRIIGLPSTETALNWVNQTIPADLVADENYAASIHFICIRICVRVCVCNSVCVWIWSLSMRSYRGVLNWCLYTCVDILWVTKTTTKLWARA